MGACRNPSSLTSWFAGSGSQGDAPGDNSRSKGEHPAGSGLGSGLATQAGTSTEEGTPDNQGSFSCNCTNNDLCNIVVPPNLVTDSGSAAEKIDHNFTDAHFELTPGWGKTEGSSTVKYSWPPKGASRSTLAFRTESCFHLEEGKASLVSCQGARCSFVCTFCNPTIGLFPYCGAC